MLSFDHALYLTWADVKEMFAAYIVKNYPALAAAQFKVDRAPGVSIEDVEEYFTLTICGEIVYRDDATISKLMLDVLREMGYKYDELPPYKSEKDARTWLSREAGITPFVGEEDISADELDDAGLFFDGPACFVLFELMTQDTRGEALRLVAILESGVILAPKDVAEAIYPQEEIFRTMAKF